jgi:DivIVA domain-containing protein
MGKKTEQETSARPEGGDTRVTPADIQQVEFRLAFRGYKERDVDAFLDRLTQDLTSYIEENQRLRAGNATAALAGVPGGLDAARSEAERILSRAREEAARIEREADLRASVGGVAGPDQRAAVAPFLNREREFLQSLGGLVQGHAEEIKQMVASIRSKAEATRLAVEAGPAPVLAPPEEAPPAPSDETAPALPAPAPPGVADRAPAPAGADEEPTTEEEAFAPITVPDAEGAPGAPDVGGRDPSAPEPTPAKLRTDSGDRSLRELFWGED